jgi:hypothetical protein
MDGFLCTLNVFATKSAFDIALKADDLKVPKLFDVVFTISALYGTISLLYLQFGAKEYIFDFASRPVAMRLSQLLAWHTLLDYICITMLPLPSFCAIKFSLLTCYSLVKEEQNKLMYIGTYKQFFVCIGFTLLAFIFDIIKLVIIHEDQ